MENNNSKVLEELLIALGKMDDKNDMVDINSMYGIFMSRINKFIICKEDKFRSDDDFYLKEFFTNEAIAFSEEGINQIFYPWRGRKYYSSKFLTIAYSVPIVELLGKFSVDEVVTERDIACLYVNVNKYIIENPEFMKQLFNKKNEKVR